MSELIKLYNDKIQIEISSFGAELQSVIKDGEECLWQGDPTFWKGRAPVLFPICGALKDNKYIYEGKEYSLSRHGFARNSEFMVEESTNEHAVFALKSNKETKQVYPFDFKLSVIYTLLDASLKIEYKVENTGTNDMFYSIGSHEAYACPDGIENYSVLFEKNENLDSNLPEGTLISYETINFGANTKELVLKKELFDNDSIILTNIKSRSAILKNNMTGREVSVEFPDCPFMLIWTVPGAKYVCLEPWCGMADFVDSNYDITNKKGIMKLDAENTDIKTHIVNF